MAYGNLFYNETRSILYGTVSLKRKNKTKKNYRLDVHANESKVPETYMKEYYYYYYYYYYCNILDNVSTRNFRMRESVIESLSQ